MKTVANREVRDAIKHSGAYQYEIAYAIGLCLHLLQPFNLQVNFPVQVSVCLETCGHVHDENLLSLNACKRIIAFRVVFVWILAQMRTRG